MIRRTLLLLLIPVAFAQTDPTPIDPYKLYRVPDPLVTVTADAVQLRLGGQTFSYISGIGWTPPGLVTSTTGAAAAPVVREGEVSLSGATLEALGLTLPRLEGVRASQGERVRVVFDFSGLDERVLETARESG